MAKVVAEPRYLAVGCIMTKVLRWIGLSVVFLLSSMALSPKQRLLLIKHINDLVNPDFESLVFALKTPRSVMPSGAAAQGDRSSALLAWVEGPTGCGMAPLLQMLNDISPLPDDLQGLEHQAQNDQSGALAQQVAAWFEALKYGQESYERTGDDYREWIITIPARRGYDRVLVRCVAGEASMAQLEELRQVYDQQRPDEGWLISNRRVAPAAKQTLKQPDYRNLYCYTLDEVIDQVADFSAVPHLVGDRDYPEGHRHRLYSPRLFQR